MQAGAAQVSAGPGDHGADAVLASQHGQAGRLARCVCLSVWLAGMGKRPAKGPGRIFLSSFYLSRSASESAACTHRLIQLHDCCTGGAADVGELAGGLGTCHQRVPVNRCASLVCSAVLLTAPVPHATRQYA